MVEFRVEATLEPGSAPAAFQMWSRVAAERDLTFVLPDQPLHPAALVLIGAMAAARRHRGLASGAAGGLAANHLASIVIQANVPASVEDRDRGGTFELIQPIIDLRTARTMADRTADAMAVVEPAPSPSIVRMARFVFEELGANIVQHSGFPESGYGFAIVDPAQRRLEFAFADAGVGFRASLQRNPELEGRVADDAEAMQLALTPRLTGAASQRTNMGFGLKALTDFSDLLGGDLGLASGSAMLVRRSTAGQRTNVLRSVPPWQGSWIALQAPVA
jgi:hypothetical protein